MGLKLNPLSGFFDLTGAGAGPSSWKTAVPTTGDLPTVGNGDGDARVVTDEDAIYVWDDSSSRWVKQPISASTFGSTPNSQGYSIVNDDGTANLRVPELVLQPADASNPGGVSTTTQTFAGDKTFANNVIITGDLTVNGTTTTINTQNLDVEDKNITVNHGGTTAGTIGSGIDIEGDTAAIVGYMRVASGDNSNLEFKAPGNASSLTLDINSTETITVAGSLNIEASSAVNQDLTTDASPTFASETLTNTTNQLVLGTTNTTTINSPAPSASRTVTIPDAGTNSEFVLTQSSQTINGNKTFTSGIFAQAGIENNIGNLNLGTVASTSVQIGSNSIPTSINGELTVVDKLPTLNSGGAAASGGESGIEIEEDSLITGYAKTSADRNAWELKAPNQAGIAVIDAGSLGITLNQSSHDPVTITAIGNTPNSSAASISGQIITLQPADGSNPGVVTTATQTFAGDKTFNNNLTVVGITTLDTALTGPLRADAGIVSSASVNLVTEVTGVLPIVFGGTNSSIALVNDQFMISSGGSIVEAGALTDGQLFIGSTGNAPIATTLTDGAGITITEAPGSITIAMTLVPSAGDIAETSFTALDNQAVAQDITGFAFANGTVRSFEAQVSIVRNTTYAVYNLQAIQKGASWEMSQSLTGDTTGITFSITSAGQVQYTSTSTGNNATLKFRALTTSV